MVDVCDCGCGGVWFDAFELQKVDEPGEEAGERLLEFKRGPRVAIDTSRKRECPRCNGIKLHRHFFSAKRRVEVDQCPNCSGYWLDAGELAAIRAEKLEETGREEDMSKASLSAQTIRYLYNLKTQARRDARPGP